jgi:hypothetical protein
VQVTNQQLYFAIGIPMLFNAGLIGLLLAYINARFTTVERSMEQRFVGVDQRFTSIDQRFGSMEQSIDQRFASLEQSIDRRFSALDQRFASLEQSIDRRFSALDQRLDDLRDVWRAELHRVEEVLDARLKHLEAR